MRRARLLAGLAFILSLLIALFVLQYWRDGNWWMLIPAIASLAVIARPRRFTVGLAIVATAVVGFLCMASVGYFFLPSLIGLVLALDSMDRGEREATA